MKDSIPTATRDKYLSGDVTPKVRITIRRTRLDFGSELYFKNDDAAIAAVVGDPG